MIAHFFDQTQATLLTEHGSSFNKQYSFQRLPFLSDQVYKHSYLLINVTFKLHYSKHRLALCMG